MTQPANSGTDNGASAIEVGAPDAVDRDWVRESLRLALLAGGFGTWEWDVDTGLVHWNATLEAIYGLPAGNFTGTVEDYRNRIHPEDRAESAKVLEEAIVTRSTFESEHRVLRPDGTVPRVGPTPPRSPRCRYGVRRRGRRHHRPACRRRRT